MNIVPINRLERDEVASRLDAEALFRHYCDDFDVAREDPQGNRMVRCPIHDDDRPSCSINTTTQQWNCHACGESGDAFRLIEKAEGLEFHQALQHANDFFCGDEAHELPEFVKKNRGPKTCCFITDRDDAGKPTHCGAETTKNDILCDEHRDLWLQEAEAEIMDAHARLLSPEGTKHRKTLKVRRGISQDIIEKVRLGILEDNTLVIPLLDLITSKLVGVRYINKQRAAGRWFKTYGNQPSRALFGVPVFGQDLWIVEGELDALAMASRGEYAMTVLTGAETRPTPEMVKLVAERASSFGAVILAGDHDQAGEEYNTAWAHALNAAGVKVRYVDWWSAEALPLKWDICDGLAKNGCSLSGIRSMVKDYEALPVEEASSQTTDEDDEEEVSMPPIPTVCWRDIFRDWKNAMAGVTAADPAFHYASLLTVLATVIGRRAHVYRGKPQYPQLFTCLVGEVGSYKSTAQGHAVDMLRGLGIDEDKLRLAGVMGSRRGLVDELQELQEGSRLLMDLDELSEFLETAIKDSAGPVLQTLSKVYESAPVRHRVKDANISIENVYVSMLCSTTTEWLHSGLRMVDLMGGFGSRMTWWFGASCDPLANPGKPQEALYGRVRGAIKEVDARLAKVSDGEYKLSSGANDVLFAFERECQQQSRDAGKLERGLWARLHGLALRFALIYAVVEDTGEITPGQMNAAVALARWLRKSALSSFQGYGSDRVGRCCDRIKEVLSRLKEKSPDQFPVRKGYISKRMTDPRARVQFDPQTVGRALDALRRIGAINEVAKQGWSYIDLADEEAS